MLLVLFQNVNVHQCYLLSYLMLQLLVLVLLIAHLIHDSLINAHIMLHIHFRGIP